MEPWKLYVMVGSFVVVDIIVLSVWQGVDPLQRTLESFPLEVPKNTVEDIKIKPELEHCESKHNTIWLGEFGSCLLSVKDILSMSSFCFSLSVLEITLVTQINKSFSLSQRSTPLIMDHSSVCSHSTHHCPLPPSTPPLGHHSL